MAEQTPLEYEPRKPSRRLPVWLWLVIGLGAMIALAYTALDFYVVRYL